jgi:hypothetical protein
MNDYQPTTTELIVRLANTGNALFEGGLIDQASLTEFIAACDRMRLLDSLLARERESRREENEFIGKAIENMALRLADCNARLKAEVNDAKMEAHLLRLRMAEGEQNIGPNARKGHE